MADHIIMLAEGEIVEQGTHDSLMEAKREYEKIYRVQAEQYLGKTV